MLQQINLKGDREERNIMRSHTQQVHVNLRGFGALLIRWINSHCYYGVWLFSLHLHSVVAAARHVRLQPCFKGIACAPVSVLAAWVPPQVLTVVTLYAVGILATRLLGHGLLFLGR